MAPAGLVLDGEQLQLPALPPVVGGSWGNCTLEGLWGPLSTDGPELVWEVNVVHGAAAEVEERLSRIECLRNQPAKLHLADGTRVSAEFGHWRRWGGRPGMSPGYTCDFNLWNVDGPCAVRWVGKLKGGGFLNGNLSVSGPGRFSANHMRLEGNYRWHILSREQDSDVFDVVIDGGPSPLQHELLGSDFNALQFAFGAPMQLDTLIAFDDPGNIAGCAGVHLGGNRITKRRRRADGPVPDDVSEECWVPVLFNRLAKAMTSDDLPWGLVCNTYLDSMHDATIDGGLSQAPRRLGSVRKGAAEKGGGGTVGRREDSAASARSGQGRVDGVGEDAL